MLGCMRSGLISTASLIMISCICIACFQTIELLSSIATDNLHSQILLIFAIASCFQALVPVVCQLITLTRELVDF